MAQAQKAGKRSTETVASSTGSGEEVARVAYELYVQRGCVDGHDLDDWLRAEAIVRQPLRRRPWRPS